MFSSNRSFSLKGSIYKQEAVPIIQKEGAEEYSLHTSVSYYRKRMWADAPGVGSPGQFPNVNTTGRVHIGMEWEPGTMMNLTSHWTFPGLDHFLQQCPHTLMPFALPQDPGVQGPSTTRSVETPGWVLVMKLLYGMHYDSILLGILF